MIQIHRGIDPDPYHALRQRLHWRQDQGLGMLGPYRILQQARIGERGGSWATVSLEERRMETDIGPYKH